MYIISFNHHKTEALTFISLIPQMKRVREKGPHHFSPVSTTSKWVALGICTTSDL